MKNTAYEIPIKEHVMFLGEYFLNQCLKVIAFQRWVNRKANNKYGMCLTPNGSLEIDDVFTDYRFNDIQKDDIVLDIGANIGGFSLFVSRMVKHVYAVEPMTTGILRQNIQLNTRNNITVLEEALGIGMLEIPWVGHANRHIIGTSLTDLITLCGGHIDFLKCDCEGGEWCIKAEELRGIRRIEAEVHNFDGKHDLNDFLKILDDKGFECDYDTPRSGIMLVHAWRKK